MSSGSSSPILTIEGPIRIQVALLEIGLLHHHEEVVPELLRALTRQIERDGVLKHPVVVDEATLVILDGTHRVEALRALGCRLVAACLVDYREPRIELKSWYRTVRGASSLRELVPILESQLGLRVEFCTKLRPEEVGVPPVALGLADGHGFARVLGDFNDKSEAWTLVKEVEGALRELGFEIGFEPEEDAMSKLGRGGAGVILMTPRITKQDVVRTALSGRVFPHKATRHVIPARPLFLNIPLEALRGDRPLRAVEEELRELLASRKLRRVPPGQLIEGRRYEEEVFVLED